MGLSHEHEGPKILAKIKIYILTRAELLFPLCYEIPCSKSAKKYFKKPKIGLIVGFPKSFLSWLIRYTSIAII
jgi:hypothetical protein